MTQSSLRESPGKLSTRDRTKSGKLIVGGPPESKFKYLTQSQRTMQVYETHTSLSFKWMHGQLSDRDFLNQAN